MYHVEMNFFNILCLLFKTFLKFDFFDEKTCHKDACCCRKKGGSSEFIF